MSIIDDKQMQETATFGHTRIDKKQMVCFKVQSLRSIPQQATNRESKIQTPVAQNLPLNFFHSPGEYNRLLIRYGGHKQSNNVERQMGIIRNLEYLNEAIFECQKQKKTVRVNEFRQKQEKYKANLRNIVSPISQKCCCCCCNSFCQQCVNDTNCGQLDNQSMSSDLLIDIEAMKRGQIKRIKKKRPQSVNQQTKSLKLDVASMVTGKQLNLKKKYKYRVEQLITNSLLKQVQKKRIREIQKLEQYQRKQMIQQYNELIRQANKSREGSKSKIKNKQISNYKIREGYWHDIKDLVAKQLKQDKLKEKTLSKNKSVKTNQENPIKIFKMSAEQMNKKRIVHGKQALKQQRKEAKHRQNKQRLKQMKLLALASQQQQIAKKCKYKPFKPTQALIECAFQNIINTDEKD